MFDETRSRSSFRPTAVGFRELVASCKGNGSRRDIFVGVVAHSSYFLLLTCSNHCTINVLESLSSPATSRV